MPFEPMKTPEVLLYRAAGEQSTAARLADQDLMYRLNLHMLLHSVRFSLIPL
jgi:hypothetical protein